MSASLLDGKILATIRRHELKHQISAHVAKKYRPPELAVVLIGEDPASKIYVKNKRLACKEVGIVSHAYDLPSHITQNELLHLIDQLNQNDEIDGILIQLPLPRHINQSVVIDRMHPEKDVDGFHPYNLGRLAQKNPILRPCTPMGIMNLLRHYKLNVKGQYALVIGASNIVGRPMSLELLMAGATVTTCHQFTRTLSQFVKLADLIVVATGVMDVIDCDWLHQNQVLIDVGIHRLADGTIRGDVNFNKASEKVAWITPVPGGVGPMTIVSLLENTFIAAIKKTR